MLDASVAFQKAKMLREFFFVQGAPCSNPLQDGYPVFLIFAMYSARVERVIKTFSPNSRVNICTP